MRTWTTEERYRVLHSADEIIGLHENGFEFSLDDYGSGYSNLTRVRQYPFTNIKIDMEVVHNYCQDRDPLLPALVQGFKEMNLSITAEGIETREMAEILKGIGCDYLQGSPAPFRCPSSW